MQNMQVELFESITRYIASLNLDGDTLRAYTIDLHKFERTIGNIPLSSITKEQLKGYLDNLTSKYGERVSLATQNRHYASLHRFFEWCVQEKITEENPMENLPRRRPNKDLGEITPGSVIRALKKEQVDKLLKCAQTTREKVLFTLLYTSGIRISEALDLNIQDITEGTIFIKHGKGNQPRQAYLSKQTEKLIIQYLEERGNPTSGPLFVTTHGQRLSYARARQLFMEAARNILNADGTPITIHQLRHTFCTERAGHIDSFVLQRLAGHNDIRTTLRYAKVSDTVAKEAFENFDEWQEYKKRISDDIKPKLLKFN
ncbi:MAG: tyrosine-type recombinase/integrase [Candidatus Melainabacteria bacterium]|nr:tyrosine-type recombinase/integrase [Candidatus Melainabacteria bacterium]